MKPLALFFCALLPMSALASSACSDGMSDDPAQGSGDAAAGRPRLAKPIIVEAACPIVIDSPPLLDSPHVAIDTPVTYNSNPPSSGPHYPIWAAFQEFEKPVDRRYTVHDLEHGAVVVSYNCQAKGAGDCAAILAGLRAAIATIPNDPLCDGQGTRVRAVLTPDPLLDVPIAAAGWGFTYRAECLDPKSLGAFLRDNYGLGPESTCASGQPML